MITSASIIICTYNRSASLIDTLENITRMAVPKGIEWEVLVVDNNSSDDTRRKIEDFIRKGHSNIIYLFEGNQGKAHALNHAISKATGEVLAFTDDDALLDDDWLSLIIDTFNRYNPDCVGGKVVPLWLAERPVWLKDNLLNVLAMLNYGDEMYELDWRTDQMLYGVNYALKKEFFINHGSFNTELCARGAGNEDHELFQRLRRVHGRAIYHPGIVVRHKVFPERMEKTYFRKWHFLVGKDRAKIPTDTRFRLLGIEGYMIRNFLGVVGNFFRSLAYLDRNSLFYHELKIILYLSFFETRVRRFINGQLRIPVR
jgi:glucosyl-dolichyl phosphate glucuronosyltransferase